jgi:hypothetical protein
MAGGHLRTAGGRSRGAGGVGLGLRVLLRQQVGRELLGSWLGAVRKLLGSWLRRARKLLRSGGHCVLLLLTGGAAAGHLQVSLVAGGELAARVLSVARNVEGSGALLAAAERHLGAIRDPAVHAVPQVGPRWNPVCRQYQRSLRCSSTTSDVKKHKKRGWLLDSRECCCMTSRGQEC